MLLWYVPVTTNYVWHIWKHMAYGVAIFLTALLSPCSLLKYKMHNRAQLLCVYNYNNKIN